MKLKRITSNDFATYGQLVTDDLRELAVTLELPWKDNEHGVSCIPAGEYTAIRYHSPKRGYDVWLVTGVPNRSAVEIHIGNLPCDTEGCILVGDAWGTIPTEAGDEPGIVRSKLAFDRLMAMTKRLDSFPLTVLDPDHL